MEEIGRRLRAAREAKGMTLEQAEEETKIRQKYLEALEAAREADIPGEVYLKGFLRTYGNYLGLDGPGLVEEYKRNKFRVAMEQISGSENPEGQAKSSAPGESAPVLSRSHHGRTERAGQAGSSSPAETEGRRLPPGQPQRGGAAAPGASDLEAVRRTRTQRVRPHGPSRMMRRSMTLLVLTCLVAAGGWTVYHYALAKPSGQKSAAATEPQSGAAAQQAGQAETKPPDAATAPPATAETKPAQEQPGVTMEKGSGDQVLFKVPAAEAQVSFEFGPERVWLSAEADGKMLFSGSLKEGQKDAMAFKGKKIEVQMGHMNGTSLVVNGQRFETPLTSGPYTLVFQAEE